MTTTICGHDRETLKRVLFEMTSPAFDPRFELIGAPWDAYVALHNPARFAEIISETLRGCGLSVNGDECDEKETTLDIDVGGMGDIITVKKTDPDGHQSWCDYTMPQARALELRLLQLPDGATSADALQALEVGT